MEVPLLLQCSSLVRVLLFKKMMLGIEFCKKKKNFFASKEMVRRFFFCSQCMSFLELP